jgi:pimeloyl-ACP methyl ester carboxylesterase
MNASTVNGTEVWLQGQGDEVILMLHGWPDTRALWDGTVAALARPRHLRPPDTAGL